MILYGMTAVTTIALACLVKNSPQPVRGQLHTKAEFTRRQGLNTLSLLAIFTILFLLSAAFIIFAVARITSARKISTRNTIRKPIADARRDSLNVIVVPVHIEIHLLFHSYVFAGTPSTTTESSRILYL